MATIFMLAAPFKGESKVKGYEGNVELESVHYHFTQSYRVELQGGGASATGGDISCSKLHDSSSALIMQFCMNGETIPTVEVHVTKTIKDKAVLATRVILGNVVVSSFSISTAGDITTENFSLNYGILKLEYTPVDEKGKTGGAVTAGYDFTAQTPV